MQAYMCATGPGTLSSAGYMTWLANDNPNYNVYLLTGTLSFVW